MFQTPNNALPQTRRQKFYTQKPTQVVSMCKSYRPSKNIPVYIAFLMQLYEEITPLSKSLLRGVILGKMLNELDIL